VNGASEQGGGRIPARVLLVGGGALLLAAAVAALLLLPPAIGLAAALSLFPLVAIGLAILRSPLLGVLLIYVLEYFRPQDLIGTLSAFRLPFLATAGVFVLFMIRVIRDPKHLVVWPRQATTLAVLVAFMALSVLTSVNNYWAFEFWRGMVLTVMLFLLTVNVVETPSHVRRLLGVLLAAHLFLCFKGAFQYVLGNQFGTTGMVGGNFLGDENDFALALIVIFPFAYFAIDLAGSAGKKILWSAVALLFLITIVLTMSRGGFIGMAATLVVCWLRSRRKLAGAVGLALLVATVAILAPPEYFEEIGTIRQTDEGTAHKRREYWMAGLRMYAEKPLIGVGPGNSKLYMSQYVDLPNANQQWGRAMHGTIPLLLAEMGTVGLLLYGVLLGQSVGDLRRASRARGPDRKRISFIRYLERATGTSIVGFAVGSTFLSALYYPHIYVLAAFCVITARLAAAEREEAG
jgi:probable O-glycosylation ligase (exosortase A-associated)